MEHGWIESEAATVCKKLMAWWKENFAKAGLKLPCESPQQPDADQASISPPHFPKSTFKHDNNNPLLPECPQGGNQTLNVLSNCFEKQMSEQRKLTSAQNGNGDVRRTSSGRQDLHHSKNTYVPTIHFSRSHFLSRQTRVSVHRVPSPAPRISRARLY